MITSVSQQQQQPHEQQSAIGRLARTPLTLGGCTLVAVVAVAVSAVVHAAILMYFSTANGMPSLKAMAVNGAQQWEEF